MFLDHDIQIYLQFITDVDKVLAEFTSCFNITGCIEQCFEHSALRQVLKITY